MKTLIDIFKLLSDVQRVRILLLLNKKELSVCQLMGIIGVSQPLISRNVALLYRGGFLEERRAGKLRFYSIRKDLSEERRAALDLSSKYLKTDNVCKEDINTLKECSAFQKRAGRCDMETLRKFMEWKKTEGKTKHK